jgi:hypothetical protein
MHIIVWGRLQHLVFDMKWVHAVCGTVFCSQARHPYLYSPPELLTMGDVRQLLARYKEVVLKYEALAQVGGWMGASGSSILSNSSSRYWANGCLFFGMLHVWAHVRVCFWDLMGLRHRRCFDSNGVGRVLELLLLSVLFSPCTLSCALHCRRSTTPPPSTTQSWRPTTQ